MPRPCRVTERRTVPPACLFAKAHLPSHVHIIMTVQEKAVARGERMIAVTMRLQFWTNNIAGSEGRIVPGFCWEHGKVTVEIEPNQAHGLEHAKMSTTKFHAIEDLHRILFAALKHADIKMLFSNRYRAKDMTLRE